MQEMFDDHALVQEALCAENCTARWIWKSGELHSAGQVPWETQSINTCPENFLWEKNKSVLVLVAPGLYQLSMGFFAQKTDCVKVYVNGEAIINIKEKGERRV